MPIRWSAVKVSETLDEVEDQLKLADEFLANAEEKALQGTRIHNLPQYMSERFSRLHQMIRDGRIRLANAILGARDAIPQDALQAQQGQRDQRRLSL